MTESEKRKIAALAESGGFPTADEMLQAAVFDSVSPAICMNEGCDYTADMEPDQAQGWCEACGTNSVRSALVLAGLI